MSINSLSRLKYWQILIIEIITSITVKKNCGLAELQLRLVKTTVTEANPEDICFGSDMNRARI